MGKSTVEITNNKYLNVKHVNGWSYSYEIESIEEAKQVASTLMRWVAEQNPCANTGYAGHVSVDVVGLQDGVVEMKKGNHYAVTHMEHYQCMVCGAINIHENHKFCPNCGLPIKWVES